MVQESIASVRATAGPSEGAPLIAAGRDLYIDRLRSVMTVVKFAATGALTCVATWLAADVAMRLPGAQRVL